MGRQLDNLVQRGGIKLINKKEMTIAQFNRRKTKYTMVEMITYKLPTICETLDVAEYRVMQKTLGSFTGTFAVVIVKDPQQIDLTEKTKRKDNYKPLTPRDRVTVYEFESTLVYG